MIDYILNLFSAHTISNKEKYFENYMCDISINDKIDGKGIIISDYILTLHHIVDNNMYIYINKVKYKLLLTIDFYDISIFIKYNMYNIYDINNDNKLIEKFMMDYQDFIKYNCISLIEHTTFLEKNFNLYHNINNTIYDLEYKKINNINLKSYLYPSIPMYIFNFMNISDTEYKYLCGSGISGNVILHNNKSIGLIVSEHTNKIEVMPFEIILDILKNYINNSNNFYYLHLLIKNNINQTKNKKILKNDTILKINGNILDNDNIFIKKYNIMIHYQTYILLYATKVIEIEFMKKKYNTDIIELQLHKYNFNNLFLNYKETDVTINIFNMIFKELSEEFLINNSYKNICTINYDDIYNKKKLIYLDKINVSFRNLDTQNNIYILNKISGHNINKLSDINKYKNNKKITLEFINSNDNIIKIKL